MKQGNACLLCGMVINQPVRGRRKKFCSEVCRRECGRNIRDIDKKKQQYIKPPA